MFRVWMYLFIVARGGFAHISSKGSLLHVRVLILYLMASRCVF